MCGFRELEGVPNVASEDDIVAEGLGLDNVEPDDRVELL
jgi:hypothetical protein